METELVVKKKELDETKHEVVIQVEVNHEPIVEVKQIVEKHNGTISVKSEAGAGTEFFISIP